MNNSKPTSPTRITGFLPFELLLWVTETQPVPALTGLHNIRSGVISMLVQNPSLLAFISRLLILIFLLMLSNTATRAFLEGP